MKHCNTNTDVLYNRPRGIKLESIIQLLLLFIGLSGVMYIKGSHYQKSDWSEAAAAYSPAPPIDRKTSVATFRIEGAQETGSPLLFILSEYDENEQYLLDTGAGNKIVLEDKTATLRFPAAGLYDVKLWKKEGNTWRLTHRKKLLIEDHVTVVSR